MHKKHGFFFVLCVLLWGCSAPSEGSLDSSSTSDQVLLDQNVGEPPTCEELTEEATAFMLEKLSTLQQCTAPTPCFVAPVAGDCFDLCNLSVFQPAWADEFVQEANEQICAKRDDCTFEPPTCPSPTTAFTDCVDGTCDPLN